MHGLPDTTNAGWRKRAVAQAKRHQQVRLSDISLPAYPEEYVYRSLSRAKDSSFRLTDERMSLAMTRSIDGFHHLRLECKRRRLRMPSLFPCLRDQQGAGQQIQQFDAD